MKLFYDQGRQQRSFKLIVVPVIFIAVLDLARATQADVTYVDYSLRVNILTSDTLVLELATSAISGVRAIGGSLVFDGFESDSNIAQFVRLEIQGLDANNSVDFYQSYEGQWAFAIISRSKTVALASANGLMLHFKFYSSTSLEASTVAKWAETVQVAMLDTSGRFLFRTQLVDSRSLKFDGANMNLSVYPNPSNGIYSINYDLPWIADVQLEIFDILGRTVQLIDLSTLSHGSFTRSFRLEKNPSGVYFLRLTAKKEGLPHISKVVRLVHFE